MSRYYDKKLVNVVEGDPAKSFHLQGEVRGHSGYIFSVKVYDVGSEWGIDNGRISKLMLKKDGQLVANFDRGWDLEPKTDGDRAALKAVTQAFSEPVRPTFHQMFKEKIDWKKLSTPKRDLATKKEATKERDEAKTRQLVRDGERSR